MVQWEVHSGPLRIGNLAKEPLQNLGWFPITRKRVEAERQSFRVAHFGPARIASSPFLAIWTPMPSSRIALSKPLIGELTVAGNTMVYPIQQTVSRSDVVRLHGAASTDGVQAQTEN
jgi:hypothetical protein